MPSPDENFPHKNYRTFHQRCLSRARDEPAETPLAPAILQQAILFDFETTFFSLDTRAEYISERETYVVENMWSSFPLYLFITGRSINDSNANGFIYTIHFYVFQSLCASEENGYATIQNKCDCGADRAIYHIFSRTLGNRFKVRWHHRMRQECLVNR